MGRQRTPKWLRAARAGASGDWLARALGRLPAVEDGRTEDAITAGRVRVDGEATTDPFTPVGASSRVAVDGQPIDLHWRTEVLAFHKPRGLVVAGHDPEGVGTVFESLRAALGAPRKDVAWHAVGRLDRDTTGLLLFTNDEAFVAFATRPETHLPKHYLATVEGRVTGEALERLRTGIDIEGVTTRPALAAQVAPGQVSLTITEGRHHQVRRMLAAVRLSVLALHRDSVGGLVLDVEPGGVRGLSDEEVRALGYQPRSG